MVPALPVTPAVPLLPAVPARWPPDPPQFEEKTTNENAPATATSAENLTKRDHLLRMLVVLSP
jgi:hypothetical protein